MQVGIGPGHIVLDGEPDPPPPKGHSPPIFGPYLLRPNGCMDQDVTWYGLGDFVFDGDPRSPSPKGGAPPQIFGPCLLWPNGWMDEAGTWHGGRPQPRRLGVSWGPNASRAPPQFSAHFYCGQTAGCNKMPLGTDVGLIPGYSKNNIQRSD